MGNPDDSTSTSTSTSTSQTQTQPLLDDTLPKLPISYTDPITIHFPATSFLASHRPLRDLPFLLLFLLLLLLSLSFGLFSVFHRNPLYSLPSSFNPHTSSCSPTSPTNTLRLSNSILKTGISALVVTFLLSFPIGIGVLWILKFYAKEVVYACLPFFVLVPGFVNVYWFVACTVKEGCRAAFPLGYRILALVFVFLVIAVVAWIILVNLHRVDLTVRIVQVAAAALAGNLSLFFVLPVVALGVGVVCLVPIGVFLAFVVRNGEFVPREKEGVHYCAWKQDGWVPAYFVLGILTMLWSLAVMVEAQVFVISGAIAQWYFTSEGEKPKHCIRNSLRHAFGPSFGTVCFSGLVIFAVRVVRSIVDSAKREDGALGIVNLIIRCCAGFLLSSIEFINKFTINFAAITGEAYCSSAKMTYELLKRNLLSAVFVETVSTRILAGIAFVISAVYAVLVFVVLKICTSLGVDAYFITVLAWLLLIVVLGFFVHVLDNVIDTIYVCYAIDRDKGEVCKPEVHEVYVFLPISNHDRPSLATRTS